jgi:cyclophilin family peptidyl-prolyl cis-trans isomerase
MCLLFLQIFFLLKESELTPSGANLLDGRYAVFGYAVNGQDNLGLMKVGGAADLMAALRSAYMSVWQNYRLLPPGHCCS